MNPYSLRDSEDSFLSLGGGWNSSRRSNPGQLAAATYHFNQLLAGPQRKRSGYTKNKRQGTSKAKRQQANRSRKINRR